MKKCIYTIYLLLTFLNINHAYANDEIKVTTTIKPLNSLVQAVIGDTGIAKNIINNNMSPHNFYLKPSHIKTLQNSDVVFYIDQNLESFMKNALKTLPNNVQKIEITKNSKIKLYKNRTGGVWENEKKHGRDDEHRRMDKHHHDDEHHEKHDENWHMYKNHHDHDNHGHNHGKFDPHVWLSPLNGIKIVKHIESVLSKKYPKYKNQFKKNAKNYIKKINTLHKKNKLVLQHLNKKGYFVFHDAYQYFEKVYSLNSLGSITFSPENNLSPKTISNIIKKVKKTNAKCVFYEPQFNSEKIKNIFKNNKQVKVAQLDPMGVNLENNSDLYLNLIFNISTSIKNCLK